MPFPHTLRQHCLSYAARSRVGRRCSVHSCILSSQLYLWRLRLLLPFRVPGSWVFEMVLCSGWCGKARRAFVVSALTRVLAFHQRKLASHIFIRFVFGVGNVEEFPEACNFKCLYAFLCLLCQSPALAYVEEGG